MKLSIQGKGRSRKFKTGVQQNFFKKKGGGGGGVRSGSPPPGSVPERVPQMFVPVALYCISTAYIFAQTEPLHGLTTRDCGHHVKGVVYEAKKATQSLWCIAKWQRDIHHFYVRSRTLGIRIPALREGSYPPPPSPPPPPPPAPLNPPLVYLFSQDTYNQAWRSWNSLYQALKALEPT